MFSHGCYEFLMFWDAVSFLCSYVDLPGNPPFFRRSKVGNPEMFGSADSRGHPLTTPPHFTGRCNWGGIKMACT